MTTETTNQHTFETSREAFLRVLGGRNRSELTLRAYRTDIQQFASFLRETNLLAKTPADVTRTDVAEYLSHLADRKLSGVTRARKLAALREYFRYLVDEGLVAKSPLAGVQTPRKERGGKTYLRPDEYTKMLSLAGGNPRDFAILTVFLQTGLRVSELCDLTLDDIDLAARTLRVRAGKGQAFREIELEKKGVQALRSYLSTRPQSPYEQLFLNRDGEPLGERGARKLVVKYKNAAGIDRKVSCHSLRHTFATAKAERGVSPFQLQRWLGHRNLSTTQIYVHMGRANAKRAMEATSL